jgi:hypothetical protein
VTVSDRGPSAASRHWIEAISGTLTLEDHGGRTLASAAARLFGLAAAIWHNRRIGAPVK